MALQTFTAGQVLTAAQVTALQTNGFNQTVSTKTADHTLVAADKGTRVEMNSASATTITVDTDLFNAGDTLFIQNRGAGVCTITAGTATVSTSGSLALAEFQGGTLYFVSAGVAIFFLVGSSGVGALKDADISGTTGSPTTATYTDTLNYKTYSFTGSGSITFTKAGLVDVLLVAGGGSSPDNSNAGGGGGGGVVTNTMFIPSGVATITIGAGGAAGAYSQNAVTGRPSAISLGTTTYYETVFGGGGGGRSSTSFLQDGRIGSSGGGGAGTPGANTGGAALLTGLGFAGGTSVATASGAGGGGAGAVGLANSGTTGGAGGAGSTNTVRLGTNVTYGGGGGGAGTIVGAGGAGGGGSNSAGSANTGGGGSVNNAGGSGLIVVRVLA